MGCVSDDTCSPFHDGFPPKIDCIVPAALLVNEAKTIEIDGLNLAGLGNENSSLAVIDVVDPPNQAGFVLNVTSRLPCRIAVDVPPIANAGTLRVVVSPGGTTPESNSVLLPVHGAM